MKQNSITPGPWQLDPANASHVVVSGRILANCDYQQTSLGGSKLANAQAISALPELLEALEEAIPYLKDHIAITIKAERALAKAKGIK